MSVKLEFFGLNGNILNWIKGFLSRRSQVVKVTGADSKSTPCVKWDSARKCFRAIIVCDQHKRST